MKVNKTILFIGAGSEMIPGIRLAKNMGLFVVATDKNPHAPGFKFADLHYPISTRDVRAMVKFALEFTSRRKIDGVMTLASDVPLTVSAVAHKLKLPGIPVEIARLGQNKLLMKQYLKKSNVPLPQYYPIENISQFKAVTQKLGFPVIIKPLDNSGARGVYVVQKKEQITVALDWAKRFSLNSNILLVEEFLPGPQISTESVVYRKKVYTTGFADRHYDGVERFYPFFIEDGHTVPTYLNSRDKKGVYQLIEQVAEAVGIDSGVIKGDLVITPQGPKVIELALRLSGGRFSTDTVPLATGVNIVKTMLNIAIGAEPDLSELKPKFNHSASQRYLFPHPGVVKKIVGVNNVKKMGGINRVEIYVKPGSVIPVISNHAERAGYVIAVGNVRDQAVKRAINARDKINIVMEN